MEATRCGWALSALLLGALSPSVVAAQGSGAALGGDVAAYLDVDNREDPRRSPVIGRLHLRPNVTLPGLATLTFDFLLSSEHGAPQSSRSRTPNEYQVGLDWGWARADVGHVKESYSPLAVRDVSVRGGGLSMRRGDLRFSAFGGRSDRAGRNGATSPFDRSVYGGRLGVGDTTRLALDVVMVQTRDDVPWLAATVVDDATAAPESGVAPQGNLVMGALGTVAIFGEALSLRGELMRSGFTHDRRAQGRPRALPEDGVDVSESVDYAHAVEATARLSPVSAKAGYRSIGTDYRSLGAPSLPTDRRELSASASVWFPAWDLSVDGQRHRDNLSGGESLTTAHTDVGANLSLRPLQTWSLGLRARYSRKGNGSTDPNLGVDQRGWALATHQGLTISQGGPLRSVTVGYEHRVTGDASPLRTDTGSDARTLDVRILASLADRLQVTPSLRLVSSRYASAPRSVRRVYAMRVQHRTGGERVRSALDVSRTEHPDAAWWQLSLTSRFGLGGDRARR